jgi:precorrin-2 dehydrogenase/sirohydrochlorin ferrochelatase
MVYYPLFLDLRNQKVIVVGGGEVAERKIRNLLTYGCRIHIASPRLTPGLRRLVEVEKILRIPDGPLDGHLDDAFMVIVATDDSHVNGRIASQAKKRGLLVNVVDQPRDCNIIVPSVVRRGDLQIAISTAGKSPALAKKIREEMEHLFGPEYDPFTALLGLVRAELLAQGRSPSENKVKFSELVNSNLLELIRKDDGNGVAITLKSILGEGFPAKEIVNRAGIGT